MYEFAGWFLSRRLKDSPNNLLRTMLPPCREIQTGENYAFAAGKTERIGVTPSVTALISGNPSWLDGKWAEQARQHGTAKSIALAFLAQGPNFLDLLSGPFSLALYDHESQQGLLAIDHMGCCPLAYAETTEGLIFAGDLSTLRTHPAIDGQPDPQALLAYLYFHMIPAPLSIYRNVRKLLPGHCLLWKGGSITLDRYWQPRFDDNPRSEAKLARLLRGTLKEAVSSCIETPFATGTFLSGGLDSSTITGLFKQLSPDAEAFSIGFAAEGYDEMEYARASARHFGVSLHEYYVTPDDVVAAIPTIAAEYDEPFGNASAVPTYYCARLAREAGKTCLLAGDGGDELFAGNDRYGKQKIFSLYERIPWWLRALLIEPVAGLDLPLLGKIKSYVEQARIPMPDRMESYNFLHRSPLPEIFEEDFLVAIDPQWPLRHLRKLYHSPETDSLLKRMLFLDWKITLADNDLRKVNRMCTLAGMEVRYPMLQRPVVELAARIPDRLLMRGFELRSFYRHAFQDFLPASTLEKRKHGFGLPFGLWLQSDPSLQALAYDSLGSRHFSGIVKPGYLNTLKSRHQQGHASYYGVMIWVLMMWAQWAEQHH